MTTKTFDTKSNLIRMKTLVTPVEDPTAPGTAPHPASKWRQNDVCWCSAFLHSLSRYAYVRSCLNNYDSTIRSIIHFLKQLRKSTLRYSMCHRISTNHVELHSITLNCSQLQSITLNVQLRSITFKYYTFTLN